MKCDIQYSRKQNDYDEKNISTMKYISILLKNIFAVDYIYVLKYVHLLQRGARLKKLIRYVARSMYVCVCMYMNI